MTEPGAALSKRRGAWEWALRTTPGSGDWVEQRKARLLAGCVLSLTAVFAVVDAVQTLTIAGYAAPWYGYVFLLGTYWVNRLGYYSIASALGVVMFPVVAFSFVVTGKSSDPVMTLAYLSLSPLLGAIFLPVKGVVALSVVNVLAVLLASVLAPHVVSLQAAVGPLSAVGISGSLAVLYMLHRDRVEADRRHELERSEERLLQALEAAHMGIWEWRLDDGTVTVSEGTENVFGLGPGEFGASVDGFVSRVHPEDRDRVAAAMHSFIDGSNADARLTHRVIHGSGEVRWIESYAHVHRDPSGVPLRVAGTVMDVSERRSLEDQLRQAQKMEALGSLAGGIAHDINNVLTVILGNVELSSLRGKTPELAQIAEAAQSASTLIRQLLGFSRRAALRPEVVDLNDVLRSTTAMLQRIIGEDVRISVVEGEGLHNARVDPGQIQEILLNLATNARDAMPHGGQLVVRTENRVVEGRSSGEPGQPGRYVLLTVSDTGEGMDEETRERVFEPFFTTKAQGKGSGLGMAMVFGIVTQSGGHIQVDSQPRVGTTFKLYFPATSESKTSRPTSSAPAARRGSETVLLVEDEEAVRSLCTRLLEQAGYEVIVATCVADAEREWLAAKARIELLLTDVVMPGESGRSFAERASRERPDLPILFMSGYVRGRDGVDGLPIPSEDLLQKPFTGNELLGRVREALDRRRAREVTA